MPSLRYFDQIQYGSIDGLTVLVDPTDNSLYVTQPTIERVLGYRENSAREKLRSKSLKAFAGEGVAAVSKVKLSSHCATMDKTQEESMDLVSLQEINRNLGLSDETIRKSSSAYAHLFEGISPQTVLMKTPGSRNGVYKVFVTKDEAALIERRYAMGKLSKTKSKNKEAQVAAALCKKLNGVPEYKTEFGRCDIVTEEFCIEVKTFKGWKGAIGQALAYATAENKKPAIALFDHKKVEELYKRRVKQTCDKFGITIFWV